MSACRLLFVAALALPALACRSSQAADELPYEILLGFEGAERASTEELEQVARAELVRLELDVPDKTAVDDAAFALELFYRTRGYPDVRVDYEFEPGPPARALFEIHEGQQVRVDELVIEGLQQMPPEVAVELFEPAASGGIYDELRVEASVADLREEYRELGHLRVSIAPPEVEFGVDRSDVTVRIQVTEGPVFVVRSVELAGGIEAARELEEKIQREHLGKIYQPFMGPQIEHQLADLYRRSGHPDAEIEARSAIDENTGDVRLEISSRPGELVRISHFRIQGNERTKDAAIIGTMDIELGSVYDSDRLRDAFRELYATGLFESIEFTLEGTGSERTLVVTVSEARSVQIRLEPGWGSYEGPRVLLGIEENNFQGRGQVIAILGTLSAKASSARIAWIDRDFLGSEFISETTFWVEQREEPSYEFVRQGFGFFLRRNWTQKWRSSFGYEFRPTRLLDESIAEPELTDDTDIASVSTTLAFDDRDFPLLPTRGTHASLRLELADDALASDTEFVRAQLELSRLMQLADDTILVASARTGVIAPFGITDEIPVTERFFNGGENTVRSFEEDELLPEGLSGEPQGGESATTLNLELRQILTGNLAGAIFADAGNVTEDVQDYLDFPGFRYGYGVGVRYQLPIGPVRFDVGWNPDADDASDEDEFVLHFSVGFPF
jgi:outer membrane protein assembly complex protein YaeT